MVARTVPERVGEGRRDYSYPAIVKMAERATPFRRFGNPDDPRFANPPSMTEAIKGLLPRDGQPEPVEDDEFIRCIFESLAFRYKEVLALLSEITPSRSANCM